MYDQGSRWKQARDRLARIDAHKATFVTGGVSLILDVLLALSALFPYYLDESISDFSFVELSDLETDKIHAKNGEIALLTAVPMISAIFSILLMMGNRLRVAITYPLFLLFNSLLIIWNILVTIAIYAHVLPQINHDQDSKLCQDTCDGFIFKLHLYSVFLIFSILTQFIFNAIVWRGWQFLKDSDSLWR